MDVAVSSSGPQTTGLPAMDGSHSQTDAFFAEWGQPGFSSLIPGLTLTEVSSPPNESSRPSAPLDTPTVVDDLQEIKSGLVAVGATSI
jgi:hypothetical protein